LASGGSGYLMPRAAPAHRGAGPGAEEAEMSEDGKVRELKGRAKEAAGAVAGDEELKREGRSDQRGGKLSQAGEKLRDAAEDVKDAVRK